MTELQISGGGIEALDKNKSDDIKWAVAKLIRFAKEEFIGNVQFNYFKGSITNANNTFSDKPEYRVKP